MVTEYNTYKTAFTDMHGQKYALTK